MSSTTPNRRVSIAVSNPSSRMKQGDAATSNTSMRNTTGSTTTRARRSSLTEGLKTFTRRSRSLSMPSAVLVSSTTMLEEHFRVCPDSKVILPGVPEHDDDWARDSHDIFNLIVLIPIVVLNGMNWDWEKLLRLGVVLQVFGKDVAAEDTISVEDAWTGDRFHVFFFTVYLYFICDLSWVIAMPNCVKSPATIYQHHVVTMLYLLVPWYRPHLRWCMGACMSVELNTWFLIARRVFNKKGISPWINIDLFSFVSIRVKFISMGFYSTWIVIRCIVYPVMLVYLTKCWWSASMASGNPFNLELVNPVMQSVFCLLNFKWTYDLIKSKIRYYKQNQQPGGEQYTPDKGL
eukprot:CAMPEP_0117011752 /NCGR_PEP_ID=MMETSP0472-20121206/10043_1 /TAXON_ID=693140 ORGANISM="Tiarina fusus, Strain LIS" /NCGR_SAMPLE_ID=MMETSP0472 /ASSEMBLY_ACC=CAM_ASM_000603 /LENGTH=346 /DNA_ID=CAMNT_0004714657 /DNA_START=128 /DNA_END=1168 /DNA_ORIENTATION=+